MRFTQDLSPASHVIRGYGGGELRIDDQIYRETVVVSASTIQRMPGIKTVHDLAALDLTPILALEPELFLLGTGERQVFPDASFRARFLSAGIGIEVMDTGAACRTFNVLVSELRRAVALLMAG